MGWQLQASIPADVTIAINQVILLMTVLIQLNPVVMEKVDPVEMLFVMSVVYAAMSETDVSVWR